MRVRQTGIAALVGVWAAYSPTVAEGAEAVHLSYDAPSRCPSENDFLDMVARDGGGLAAAPELQPARSFLLRVSGTAPVTGTLVVRERNGTAAQREVVDVECDVVVRALAVLVALSLDSPDAAPSDPRTSEVPTASPPASGPPETAPEPELAGPLPPVPGMAASSPVIDPPASEIDQGPVGRRPPRGWRIDVSAEGTLSTGAMPSLDPGLAAYVELLDETPRFLSPSIRLGAETGLSQGGPFPDSVIFRRFVGRLDACPFRGVLARPWSDDAFTLQPCVRLDIGRIEVEESESWATVDAARLWVAPAGLLRLRWTSPHLFVEAEGGISFPLVREHFSTGGSYAENLDFEVPPRAMTSGLGLGAFIW